jgi:hypothetical protein
MDIKNPFIDSPIDGGESKSTGKSTEDIEDINSGSLLNLLLNSTDNADEYYHRPQIEFLDGLLRETDGNIKEIMIQKRIEYLMRTNHAERMSQMSFFRIAVNRSPAIIVTLVFELLVGVVIALNHTLIKKYILLPAFIPVLSSISGNVGLQSSSATIRALSTGHVFTVINI